MLQTYPDLLPAFIQGTKATDLTLIISRFLDDNGELEERFRRAFDENSCITSLYLNSELCCRALLRSSLTPRLKSLQLNSTITFLPELVEDFSRFFQSQSCSIQEVKVVGGDGDLDDFAIACVHPRSSILRFECFSALRNETVERVVQGSCPHVTFGFPRGNAWQENLNGVSRLMGMIRRESCRLKSLTVAYHEPTRRNHVGNGSWIEMVRLEQETFRAFCQDLAEIQSLQEIELRPLWPRSRIMPILAQLFPGAIERNTKLIAFRLKYLNGCALCLNAHNLLAQIEPTLFRNRIHQMQQMVNEEPRILPRVFSSSARMDERFVLFRRKDLVQTILTIRENAQGGRSRDFAAIDQP